MVLPKNNSLESLSSLHAVEHFGLGRYGDSIDPDACFKAMKAMQRVLKPEGILYFSVPIGKREKLCFNAHRIFDPFTITDTFNELSLINFYYIGNDCIHSVTAEEFKAGNFKNALCDDNYGYAGVYVLKK